MTRVYDQGVATLGYQDGPKVAFRLNPEMVNWNFQMNTAVTETIGGRVVQVLGANLSDITVRGSFGGGGGFDSKSMAENFLLRMKDLAEYQSRDAINTGQMHEPAQFSYPPKNWLFAVYVKALTDSLGGQAITHTAGRFSYDYVLTLMFHEDLSGTSQIVGKSNGWLSQKADAAVQSYLDRIYDGIGWKESKYNGPFNQTAASAELTSKANLATAAKAQEQAAAAKAEQATAESHSGPGGRGPV